MRQIKLEGDYFAYGEIKQQKYPPAGQHSQKGSAVLFAAIFAAVLSGLVALSVTRLGNVSYKMLDSASIRNQAMQYVLNSADTVRATRYDDLQSSALAQVGSTRFYRSVTVENDASAIDKKIAIIKVFANKNDANPIAEMVVNKSRINEVLYDTIGNHTDGAMTQEASTRLFALVDNVFSKDEAYQTFITQSRAEALLKALEDAIADEYLSKTDADNIYRKIADSYSKGQTDSLLDALKDQVNVNKANIAINGSNISSVSDRLKTMEDAMSLYLKIKDAADIYLTQTVAASTYATKATAVTHVANTAVGSSTRPVYVDANGNAKALSGTVGSATEPIYLKDGVFTKTSGGGGSQVAVTAGFVKDGDYIPVPAGFTRAQCRYVVWMQYIGDTDVDNSDNRIDRYDKGQCVVDQSTGKVICRWYLYDWERWESKTAQYLCIAVK